MRGTSSPIGLASIELAQDRMEYPLLFALCCNLGNVPNEPELLERFDDLGRQIHCTESKPEVEPLGTVTDAKKRRERTQRMAVIEGERSEGVSPE